MSTLSQKTIDTVKSTAPLIAEQGPSIISDFYERLFVGNPELLNIFNRANQRKGTQAEALFNAVVAYANNIDNIAPLVPVVTQIAHKHASLNIQPEHYGIVGKHLLETIQSAFDLPQEHDILVAWAEAYQLLAGIFIDAEETVYKTNAHGVQGWRDFKPFVVEKIIDESPLVKSFYLKPADNKPVQTYKGGQYISVKVKPDGSQYDEIRQYSLSDYSGNLGYRISTKLEGKGVVTQYMHSLKAGDQLQVHAPTGVFNLQEDTNNHVFISGGVGITALLSMLKELDTQPNETQATFIQCVRDKSNELFVGEINNSKSVNSYKLCLEHGNEGDAQGFIDERILNNWLPDKNANVYLCGPMPFMKAVYSALISINVPAERIHYEVFGPTIALN